MQFTGHGFHRTEIVEYVTVDEKACTNEKIQVTSIVISVAILRIIVMSKSVPKIWHPKTTRFQRLHNSMATLRANISGKEHDTDNRETAL